MEIHLLMPGDDFKTRTGLDAVLMFPREKSGSERAVGDNGDAIRSAVGAELVTHLTHALERMK